MRPRLVEGSAKLRGFSPSSTLTLPPEAIWQVVQDRNPVLWQTIVETRARIRGT
jgi:hypothetical protein